VCPFDKNSTFLMEVTKENSDLILDSDGDYNFKQFYNIYFTPNPPKFIAHERYDLHALLVYFIPFYNEMFVENEHSFYFLIKSFFMMGILKTHYEKWTFTLLLNEVLYGNIFVINEGDVEYFGGNSFISLMNKYFGKKIIISGDKNTEISFNPRIWCPKYLNCYNFETNTMIYLYETIKLENPGLNQMILDEKEINYHLDKHNLLMDVFKLYWKVRLENAYEINKFEVPECLHNNKYFDFYFTLLNNSYFI
jgi:hypothetical protein